VNVTPGSIALVVGMPAPVLSAGSRVPASAINLEARIPSVRVRLPSGGSFASSSSAGSYSMSNATGTLSGESAGGYFDDDV
jgi:hypothetical protein